MPQSEWNRSVPKLAPYQWVQNGYTVPAPNGAGIISLTPSSEYVKSTRTGNAGVAAANTELVQTSGSHAAFLKELKSEDSYRSAFDGSYDNGHEFLSEKHVITYPQINSAASRTNGTYGNLQYTGPLYPYVGTLQPPVANSPSHSKIMADGRELIGMTIPTKPEAGLAQFLGEVKERLPSLIGMSALRDQASAKKIGDEHLNLQFGVKPFINDLRKLAQAVLAAHKMTAQYQRDSGQNVRRRRQLRSDSRYEARGTLSGGGAQMGHFYFLPLSTEFYGNSPEVTVGDFYTTDTWFSGAYTYYLSQGHSFLEKMGAYEEKANHLLGTRLNADVVWELTPWSWLIDWFSDVGTFMSNVSLLSEDSLVLRYGYVMHETHATRSYSQVGMQLQQGAVAPTSLSLFYEIVRKQRTRATPYGFNVDLSALSPSRIAILAALGLSKGGTNLR